MVEVARRNGEKCAGGNDDSDRRVNSRVEYELHLLDGVICVALEKENGSQTVSPAFFLITTLDRGLAYSTTVEAKAISFS